MIADNRPIAIREVADDVSIPFGSYTYIHNWSLQTFSQDYWPTFSH